LSEERLQEIIDVLADRFGCPVVLDDEAFRLVAYTRHDDGIDEVRTQSILAREPPPGIAEKLRKSGVHRARSPVVVPADSELGMVERVCSPVRFEGQLLGFIWLIDPKLDEQESLSIAAEQVAKLMMRRLLGLREASDLLSDLLCGAADQREAAATALGDVLEVGDGSSQVAVIAWRGASEHNDLAAATLAKVAEAARRGTDPGRLTFLQDHDLAVLIADPDAPARRSGLEAIEAAIAAHVRPDFDLIVGLGEPRGNLALAFESLREAEAAVLVARQTSSGGSTLPFADTGPHGYLARLGADRLAKLPVPRPLEQLLARDQSGALALTLSTYLDHGCDARSTAAALSIHRGTLYQRLHRIEELANVDLSDGQDRLLLHLGLKVGELTD
jgi:hypothetical protein